MRKPMRKGSKMAKRKPMRKPMRKGSKMTKRKPMRKPMRKGSKMTKRKPMRKPLPKKKTQKKQTEVTEWRRLLMKVYNDMKKQDPSFQFKDAYPIASKIYNKNDPPAWESKMKTLDLTKQQGGKCYKPR